MTNRTTGVSDTIEPDGRAESSGPAFRDHRHGGPPSVEAAYDQVASHYDRFAAHWDRIVNRAAIRQYRVVVSRHVHSATRVLDVGTGTGRSVVLLHEEAGPRHVIGIDYSAGMLAKAREKFAHSQVALVQADALHLPFPDNSFDVVTSMWVLETLPHPLAALHEFLRVVRPEGRVLTLFSTRPRSRARRMFTALLERVAKPELGWTFLPEAEQPLHSCTMHCAHRYEYGLNTVATFGKRCQIGAEALLSSGLSRAR